MTAHPVSKTKIRKRLGCGCIYIDVHQTDDGRMKRCPICHRLSVIHVRRAIYTDGWCAEVEVEVAPVEPAAAPPAAAETFPGTGRRGRGGNLAPAGNTKGAA